MVTAFDLMSSPVYVVNPEDTVSHARMVMLKKDVGRLVVVEEDRPVGLIAKSDIGAGIAQDEPPEKRRPVDTLRVSRIMTGDIITVTPSTELEDVATLLMTEGISGVPVVEDESEEYREEGDLLGILTKKDITRHYASLDDDLTVHELYTPVVKSVHRHSSLNRVVEEMLSNGIHRVIVKEDNGAPIGIITKSDLAFTDLAEASTGLREKRVKMTRKEEPAGEKKLRSVREVNFVAEDIMSTDVVTVELETLASDAAKLMIDRDISGLPVMNDGDTVGIITETDIVRAVSKAE